MSKRKDVQPDVNEDRTAQDRPQRPEPDTLEGPGQKHESKGEQDAVNKTTRRGER